MPLSLRLRSSSRIPIEMQGILPEKLDGCTLDEIQRAVVFHGNRQVPLGELFNVSGSADDRLELTGDDLSNLHGVGASMTRGEIRVVGDVGRHLGAEMQGGDIVVDGTAADWAGAEMHGGRIRIAGGAGHLAGGTYRGSARGMTGGTLMIGGDAGNEIGRAMRRGTIAVGGTAGDGVGYGLLAGTIVVAGMLGLRTGANMRRGTIISLSAAPPVLLPTFRAACRLRPTFWRLLATRLRRDGFKLAEESDDLEFELFHGDFLAGGKGDLLIAAPR